MQTLWVVGKFRADTTKGKVWDLVAVCQNEYLAINACENHFDYFIGPIKLNVVLPYETTEWPGFYYPYEL
jgi:hypothetical protein